jgi:hypothetical protein
VEWMQVLRTRAGPAVARRREAEEQALHIADVAGVLTTTPGRSAPVSAPVSASAADVWEPVLEGVPRGHGRSVCCQSVIADEQSSSISACVRACAGRDELTGYVEGEDGRRVWLVAVGTEVYVYADHVARTAMRTVPRTSVTAVARLLTAGVNGFEVRGGALGAAWMPPLACWAER